MHERVRLPPGSPWALTSLARLRAGLPSFGVATVAPGIAAGPLFGKRKDLVRAILAAEVDARSLARRRQRAVRNRVAKLREEAAPLEPAREQADAIAGEERARYAPLVDAVRAQASADRGALRAILAAAGEDCEEDDPFAEDFGEDEEKSEEDRERERYEERLIREQEKSERGRLYRAIMEQGGLRTREDLREEYAGIPNTLKRRDGMAGDDLADHLARHHAEFGIESERDLIDFLAA